MKFFCYLNPPPPPPPTLKKSHSLVGQVKNRIHPPLHADWYSFSGFSGFLRLALTCIFSLGLSFLTLRFGANKWLDGCACGHRLLISHPSTLHPSAPLNAKWYFSLVLLPSSLTDTRLPVLDTNCLLRPAFSDANWCLNFFD